MPTRKERLVPVSNAAGALWSGLRDAINLAAKPFTAREEFAISCFCADDIPSIRTEALSLLDREYPTYKARGIDLHHQYSTDGESLFHRLFWFEPEK